MRKTLGLALVAAALVTTPALADTHRLPTQGLDTPAGAASFDARLRRATSDLCRSYLGYSRAKCASAVREEALSQLPAPQRLAYENGRSSARPIALASL